MRSNLVALVEKDMLMSWQVNRKIGDCELKYIIHFVVRLLGAEELSIKIALISSGLSEQE